jgi:demethylmenaquinone methyltransferase/2-methoxy-6-polyprenyl-1,4-benzoquinol methylase
LAGCGINQVAKNLVQHKSKEEYVHEIFSTIAERYDPLNSLLSFGQDKFWRQFAIRQTGLKTGGSGLDVCCGTGMFAIEQAKVVGLQGKVVGLDFCESMLAVARKNITKTPYVDVIELVSGNAINLPFAKGTFDCATIGFALRNVPDIPKTIAEMARVVRPGGKVVSLELSKPTAPVFKHLYFLYFNYLLPVIGRLGAGINGPYRYLPDSLKDFPGLEEIKEIFNLVGLKDVYYSMLTGGVVSVHVGTVA